MSSQSKAPRVVLGKRPTTFTKTVEGPMADGTIGAIDMVFRYRTRTEWGALLDAHQQAKRERTEAALKAYLDAVAAAREASQEPPTAPGAGAAQREEVDADARLVLDVASGWDLPDPFSLESVRQLADEAPGLITEIIRTYGAAIHEGRLGN